jgi:uncharacterized membrane protein YbhN (UPF0104 family)
MGSPYTFQNMSTRGKQIAKLIIRFLITIGLLIWVFSQVDLGRFWRAVTSAQWPYLIAVWVLTAILFWIRSVRMKLVLKRQSCSIDVNTLFGATTITALYSMIVPGILSTGVKWYILKKSSGKGSNVLSSMIYNQFITMAVMTAFGLVALIVSNPASLLVPNASNHWLLPVVCGLLLIVLLLFVFLVLNQRLGGKIIGLLKIPLKPLPAGVGLKGREILDQIAVFQTVGWRFHLVVASIITVDTLVGGVVTYILAARTANIAAPALVFVWLCAAIYVMGRFPISVANLGVREITLVGFLAIYNVEKPAALLMSMILFSALVAMAIVGAAYQIVWAIRGNKATPPIET